MGHVPERTHDSARIRSIGELQELCYSDPQEGASGPPPPGTGDPPLMRAQTASNTHHRPEYQQPY